MERRVPSLVWAALLAAGAALHVWGLSSKALWYDEITTAVYAAMAPRELWAFLSTREVHPPLFFFVSKLMLALPLAAEWSLRLVPLFAALACIPLAEGIARRGYGVRAWGALLAAFFPGLVFYAQEARAYAPLVAVQLLAVYALLRLREEPAARRFVVLAAAALWLGAAMHYFAILFVVPLGVMLLLWTERRGFTLAVLAAAALLYAPWIPVALRTFFGSGDLLRNAPPRTLAPADYFGVFAYLWGNAWIGAGVLLLTVMAAAWAFRTALGALVLALAAFTPLFLTALPPTYPYFPARYVIAWAALPILLLPALLAAERPQAVRRISAALLAALMLACLVVAVKFDRTPRDWNRTLGADYAKYFKSGDVVVVSPFYQSLALEYYLPVEPSVRAELLSDPLKNYDGVRMYVKDRFVVLVSPERLVNVLSNRKGLSGNLWFLQYGPLPEELQAWKDLFIPIQRWPDATLSRVEAKVLVDSRTGRLFLGAIPLGIYQPEPEHPLP
jgi:uncharacterized membrane protein